MHVRAIPVALARRARDLVERPVENTLLDALRIETAQSARRTTVAQQCQVSAQYGLSRRCAGRVEAGDFKRVGRDVAMLEAGRRRIVGPVDAPVDERLHPGIFEILADAPTVLGDRRLDCSRHAEAGSREFSEGGGAVPAIMACSARTNENPGGAGVFRWKRMTQW